MGINAHYEDTALSKLANVSAVSCKTICGITGTGSKLRFILSHFPVHLSMPQRHTHQLNMHMCVFG